MSSIKNFDVYNKNETIRNNNDYYESRAINYKERSLYSTVSGIVNNSAINIATV
jgi:hypothetical protein